MKPTSTHLPSVKTPSQFNGTRHLYTVPTGMSMDYGRMARRWLGGQKVRVLQVPLGPFRADVAVLAAPNTAAPLQLSELPQLDAVILSHDHYDHLDEDAIRVLSRTGVPFFCPLGVGGHLRR